MDLVQFITEKKDPNCQVIADKLRYEVILDNYFFNLKSCIRALCSQGYPAQKATRRTLDDLEKQSNIKAVVVRINSPGGTVAATQEIFEKIMKLRKKNIPVVASMGDVAASGGYYVAAACNHIVANYGTVTGSIGVIAFSPNLKRLFDKNRN